MKKISLRLVLFSFLGLFIILGAGCNPFAADPKEIISEMKENMAEVETFHYDFSANVSGAGADITSALGGSENDAEKTSEGTVNIEMSGDADMRDEENPKSLMKGRVVFSSGGTQLIADFENRKIEGVSYIKFNQAPNLGFLNLNNLAGEWYRFDLADFSGEIEEEKEELTEEQVEALRDLVKETNFFTFKEDLGKEKVNGVKTYHYRVALDKKALKNFAIEYRQITGDSMSAEETADLGQSLNNVGEVAAELWIGTKDKLLYKAKTMNIEFRNPDQGTDVTIMFIINMSDFNEDVIIEVPIEAKSSDELMNTVFGGIFGGGFENIFGTELGSQQEEEEDDFSDALPEDFDEEEFQDSLNQLNEMMEQMQNNQNFGNFNQ